MSEMDEISAVPAHEEEMATMREAKDRAKAAWDHWIANTEFKASLRRLAAEKDYGI